MRMVAPRTGVPEVTVAEEQEEYAPITVGVYGDNRELGPRTLLTRWRLSDEDRRRIAEGEDLYVAVVTYGQPMQPLHVQIGPDGWE